MVCQIGYVSDNKKIITMKVCIFILIFLSSVSVFAQSERKFIREGNRQYDNSKYSESEISYRKAMDKNPKSFEAGFNIGNSLYKQGKYPDAANQFSTLSENAKDKDRLNKLYYNLGNSYLKDRKLKESVDAYEKALINRPDDMDAKYNLSYALKLMKQQNQKDKQNDKKNKDKNKDQNKDKDKNKDNDKKDQKEKQKDQNKQMSQEDAQRMLDALQNDEKDTEKKLKEQKATREKVKVTKNW